MFINGLWTSLNVQPLCESPVDGCVSTGSGLRLCCNPKHTEDPTYKTIGPVYHYEPLSQWNEKSR